MKNYLFWFVIVVVLFISFQCRRHSNANCENGSVSINCNSVPIDSGEVIINLSYVQGAAGVPVILYKGDIEDNNVLWSDTVYTDKLTFYLPNKTRYAAEAYYRVGTQLFIALDGKRLKQKTREECNVTCYYETSIKLDVRK